MSRVGKQPVVLPDGVKASIVDGVVSIEGPKGKLEYKPVDKINVVLEDSKLIVSATSEDKETQAHFGTTRAHLNNMAKGVTEGWKRSLELNGVGFTASLSGDKLKLSVGYSHDVFVKIPEGVNCKVQKTNIDLESKDKQLLGNLAASIRRTCPPEPYLGKGIKYSDEQIRRKAGKTAK